MYNFNHHFQGYCTLPTVKNDSGKPAFKSSLPKLAAFFRKSRDNWKIKYMEAKRGLKRLSEQVRYWKRQAAEARKRVDELEREVEQMREKAFEGCQTFGDKFDDVPAYHQYSYGHIYLFLCMVLQGCVSMRAASRVLSILNGFLELGIDTPSWSAGRLWLLRIGLYKLQRPKIIADDWIWIIDHTVQLGNEKCMVILGVREKSLPASPLYLTHEDVEPLALIPVEKSNGEIVFQQLEQTVEKTGVPKQIVSDHGTDIKSGAEKFCEKYDTVHIYDFKHKGAAILKRELENDSDWDKFSKLAGNTSKKVQQTKLADMAPPNQRSKARYMNADKLVNWGIKIVLRLDIEKRELGNQFENCKMYEKFGWICEYRNKLHSWKSLVDIVKTATSHVNVAGIYEGLDADLREQFNELHKDAEFYHIEDELIEFCRQQQKKLKCDNRLLGSSEIIESVIGKYKGLQDDQVKGGFTGMILGLAASVSDLSMDTVKKAINSTSTKKVWSWIKENVGKSVHARRKEFHKIVKQEEQKLAENFVSISA